MKLVPKSNFDLQKMRAAGRLAAEVLDMITPHVQPGISTKKLNDICHDFVLKHGAKSATLGYTGGGHTPYPGAVCISLNEVVCHGIPSETEVLKDGDILNIDVTVIKDGFYGDTSRMYAAGTPSPVALKLIQTTHSAMMAGINTVKSGSFLKDIGNAIEAVCAPHGYSIVREYCGHGLGKVFHDDPQVLHYANNEYPTVRLKKGLTFTIEPMVNLGTWRTQPMPDGWTVITADRKLSAQYEHSLAVTEDGTEILTLSPEYGHNLPLLG